MTDFPRSGIIPSTVIDMSRLGESNSQQVVSSADIIKSLNGQVVIIPQQRQQRNVSISGIHSIIPTPNPISVPRVIHSKAHQTIALKDSESFPKLRIQYSANNLRQSVDVKHADMSVFETITNETGLSTNGMKMERDGLSPTNSPSILPSFQLKSSSEPDYQDSEYIVSSDVSSTMLSAPPLISFAQGSLVQTALPTVQIASDAKMLIRNVCTYESFT